MDLVACNEVARQNLVDMLFEINEDGTLNAKLNKYVSKTFPILLDVCRLFTEQAIQRARLANPKEAAIIDLLKPYFMFESVLGKCPQITSLMYHYFETSYFQPLPDNLFEIVIGANNEDTKIFYTYPGFNDNLLKEILRCLFKYLSYNPKWFSTIWNWSELGRIVTAHSDPDLRYLAGVCLSVITKPTRNQHILFMRHIIGDHQLLVELQVKHRAIFMNSFRPYIETDKKHAEKFADAYGKSETGYSYCQESIARLGNILLLKRDINAITGVQKSQLQDTIKNFIPVKALDEAISKISYSIAVNKPCLIRGASGAGKTAIIDYIAAQVNRIIPPDYIKVQISDQIDSKLLIGSYICTEIPGQFEWQPGPLTKALTYGSWIVFEDLDSAPADMVQVLHSVIENGTLSCIPSCPMKLDKPHPDSRIFFTQRNSGSDIDRLEVGFVRELCDVVDVPDLKEGDFQEIIQTKYNFGQLTETILRLFNDCTTSLKNIEASHSARSVSPRDLFKLCKRISKDSPKLSRGGISVPSLENLFLDAIDCFAASIPKASLIKISENLGRVLNIAPNDVKRILYQRRPDTKEDSGTFNIGRAILRRSVKDRSISMSSSRRLAHTKQSLQILESISVCVSNLEPVLLVGETGVGKTSVVQHLAEILNVDLVVVNLSHQSDSSDLLGGYKPVDLREVIRPIHMKFEELFRATYDMTSNQKFLRHVNECFMKPKSAPSQWVVYLKLLCTLCNKAQDNKLTKTSIDNWIDLHVRVKRLLKRVLSRKKSSPMGLKFSDGSLLSAVKNGKWILLDEINLAEPEVLQCIWLILDSINKPQVFMPNVGEGRETFPIHKNFRLFACMNPATDIGKKDLDSGTRSRFTEIFVDDITEKSELRLIAEAYVKSSLSTKQIESVIDFYLEMRGRRNQLRDVSGNSPLFSLRTLCRALTICSLNICRNTEKSLLESLRITFLQQLDDPSTIQVMKSIEANIFPKETIKSLTNAAIPEPQDGHQYVMAEGFWIQRSNEEPAIDPDYILTPSVKRNLQNIARIISLSQRKLPILLQGNTSVGKTSLILYLAKLTGNKCYRINNHEHTDLQEYVGRYILRQDGELVFQEGLLVRAMKKGHWLILDELNLAPSELLEALNRVLDENRELYIAETGEFIKAHSKFVLFATQNPPQEYAGRKLLSKAFRNRFIELHFDEIPRSELETILEKRCRMAPKYAKKIIEVMVKLQLRSRESGCFNGRNSFMTMRDLFRWGERYAIFKKGIQDESLDWELYLASQGLILLEGRVRTIGEADTVKEVLEQVFNKKLDRTEIYGRTKFNCETFSAQFKHIHFSPEFQRLFVQLTSALKYKEPVLLCGQTGSGKTTACQLYADMTEQDLITYNCHQNTESADFVGGVRPCRVEDSNNMSFTWLDGPLVEAMKRGAVFLMDEISLADDAVLERINSVLEPDRSITLTEKNGDEIYAADSFRFVATMNPGGDYGKKELSTALRNRFTEIYCHNTTHIDQIRLIIQGCLPRALLKPRLAPNILYIMTQFFKAYYTEQDIISIRDVLSWCKFVSKTTNPEQLRPLTIQEAIVNGASLVFFDQFGTSGYQPNHKVDRLKSKDYLRKLVYDKFGTSPVYIDERLQHSQLKETFKFSSVIKGPLPIDPMVRHDFILDAPIVKNSIKKIIRAMQLDKPILLEGAPGAGKTSIISALARLTGHELVRINLSDQTDISDLIGADLPSLTSSENEKPTFCWRDGPFLRAIKESQWILLDEMNLASQSVLEGLNACFDHRGEIFIPELNKKIIISKSTTRVFACQNPHSQGASRKGLPKSFLNRFTSIYIESHSLEDLFIIVKNKYSSLPDEMIDNMIKFNNEVGENYQDHGFEFNLRDVLYWCELLTKYTRSSEFKENNMYRPELYAPFVYLDRIRWHLHKIEISDLFEQIFNCPIYEPLYRSIQTGEYSINLGRSMLPRKTRSAPQLFDLCILKYQLPYMESIAKAIEFNKMPIIVGESGVGKRSMVRILAGLTGNELHIIGANCEMDTTEFLGSYEQRSAHREVEELIEEAEKCILEIVNSFSHKKTPEFWTDIFSRLWISLYPSSIRNQKLSKNDILDSYRNQLIAIQDILHRLKSICGLEATERLGMLNDKIVNLSERILSSDESMYSPGHFQWIDSVLTRAIRDGSWLLIENASLIDPAIFDRLNSLFEPNGSIALIEKGSDFNGGVETLVPHKDFRLILTVNPEHGELSSAIRNRGVEIFVRTRFFFEDFLMLLNQCGFEPEKERVCMTYCIMQTSHDVHQRLTGEDPAEDGSLLSYFGLNYVPKLSHEIRRGVDVDKKLSDLLFSFYKLKGYAQDNEAESVRNFVSEQLIKYGKSYLVDFQDERYKWMQLRHDLAFLTGGDAITEKLDRENGLFFEDCYDDLVLKSDEKIDHIDIVNSCTTLKIFLELSTHGDFDYRKQFIVENFKMLPDIIAKIENHVELLNNYSVPLIKCHIPRSDLAPICDLQIDTRNSPYIHYHLQSLDLKATIELERQQNRWMFTLQRIMLSIIVDLIESRTAETPGLTSLWQLSERVRVKEMAKEHLINPTAEIVCDLYDLLDGIVRVASNRCFDNDIIVKMLPRLFWISFFICKLKKHSTEAELIATCNQIPMLWALTYQKVVVPIIKDCDLADIFYKNKKISNRIQHICDRLEMPISKATHTEKSYCLKVLNLYASTSKIRQSFSEEVEKMFALILARYTSRTQALSLGSDNIDTLAASGLVWSKSLYMSSFYEIEDKALDLELHDKKFSDDQVAKLSNEQELFGQIQTIMIARKNDYQTHEDWLKNEQYRTRCLNYNRQQNALDQFAPLWQLEFIQLRLASLTPNLSEPSKYSTLLKKILKSINGIILSPRYYSTLMKFLQTLQDREEVQPDWTLDESTLATQTLKENVDMFASYLVDHLLETVVLDNQIVGWTKLRVTTCDLPALAPLIPEYSPLISLVGSYSLDISHLKLNSYRNGEQLDSLLAYFWQNYVPIKIGDYRSEFDLNLAQKLIHLRSEVGMIQELVGSYQCSISSNCLCVDEYIKRRLPKYEEYVKIINEKLPPEFIETTLKATKLIYFGYFNYLEYAPLFTFDPSLRSREKLDVYKSELAHIKMDLHFRNTLFYWKTGENLQLNEIDSEGAMTYPFSTRILVDRRIKLEKSINKLKKQYNNRPKSNDGSLYFELRKEVENDIEFYTSRIHSLIYDITSFACCSNKSKEGKFNTIVTKCRTFTKNLEKSIIRFRSEYSLYTDLTTNFLVGMCFVLQGLRCLYSRFEQRIQINNFGFTTPIEEYSNIVKRIFSFNDYSQAGLESVRGKLEVFPLLDKICPQDKASRIQSILLQTVLMQLNHHIVISPPDIKKCIPIVRGIADLFCTAWIKRKQYLEEQRKQREELYQYKTSNTTLGIEISYEKQEFLDICAKFPLYDHVFQSHLSMPLTSSEKENLDTEEKIINLNRSVDLGLCIDICKAHYKFTKEAGRNLLGQIDPTKSDRLPDIQLKPMIKLEAETFYSVIRHCIPTLDAEFDSFAIECHMLQAKQLKNTLKQTKRTIQHGSLKSSIEILDENIFDIYLDSDAFEALKLQEFILKVNERIRNIQITNRSYESDPTLFNISRLNARIGSFLLSDPLMKFITGSHALLEKLEEWNKLSIPKADKMIQEALDLIGLIKSWRSIEIDSWRSSLHRVKRKYIDSTLCDLWFTLYEAFRDPIKTAQDKLRSHFGPDAENFVLTKEYERLLYEGFSFFIKEFIMESTLGDYQIRLDLVFSFVIQTRFASLYEQDKPNNMESDLIVDNEKLTSYVYNTYRLHQGLMEPIKDILEREELEFSKKLNEEIRIVNWQGRNLWEVKNNFRISHRKLNRVMNKYLEVLRRPQPGYLASNTGAPGLTAEPEADKLAITLGVSHAILDKIDPPRANMIKLAQLKKVPHIIVKMKELFNSEYLSTCRKHVENIAALEQSIKESAQEIVNFYSHKVQEVTITAKDTKESKQEKQKLCRQMYHSKKAALQRLFKELKALGVSYLRGKNSKESLDGQLLSLEPLRGMIQNQSKSVSEDASWLVDDKMIISISDQYRKLVAQNMYLLDLPGSEDLTSDQLSRIQGYALDIEIDIIKQKRGAASIYKHLVDIHAAATRLRSLKSKSTLFNFSNVYKVICQFNDLVGRSYLALSKLEELADCKVSLPELQLQIENNSQGDDNEKSVLFDLISSMKKDNSIMTDPQYHHMISKIPEVRQAISGISYELRDMLNCNIRNYFFSGSDYDKLQSLYDRFLTAFKQILSTQDDETVVNSKPGTLLGSFWSLLEEAEQKIKPSIEGAFSTPSSHDTLDRTKLYLRLQKLIRQVKLASQEIYGNEQDSDKVDRSKVKPYHIVDSSKLERLLRMSAIAKHTGDCFMTLNRTISTSSSATDIASIVSTLSPLLSIFTQTAAFYFNITLASLNVKLIKANQLASFFIDLVSKGFGLPYKIDESSETGSKQGKVSEDNTGFGEGEGEKDASKKIEFESQLDDLKKSGDDNEKSENGDSVEAHNDGIEMSDDIDAKAKSDDKTSEEKGDDDDEEEEEQEDLDQLDNELDTVDNGEVELKQEIWGDEDETLDEDDEKDLRDADADPAMETNKDETDLKTKDDTLSTSKSLTGEEDNKELANQDEAEGKKSNEKQKDQEIGAENLDKDDQQVHEELDIENESQQAKKNAETIDSESQNKSDEVDMDLANADDDDETSNSDLKGNENNDENKSEGELSGDEEEIDIEGSDKSEKEGEKLKEEVAKNLIDDSDIDKQLEKAIETSVDKELDDPINEIVQKQKAEINHGDKETDSGGSIECKAYGTELYVCLFDETAKEDPLDIDDDNEEIQEVCGEKNDIQGPGKHQFGEAPANEDQELEAGGDFEDETESKSSRGDKRRTLAESNESGQRDLKRQKILNAADSEQQKEELNKPKDLEESKKSSEVRHIEEKKDSEIECIDLVSDDDDDCIIDDKHDARENNELKLNVEQEVKKDDFTKALDLAPNEEELDVEKVDSNNDDDDQHINAGELQKEPQVIDEAMELSSVSSLESGELREEQSSDDDDIFPPEEVDTSQHNTTYNTNLGLLKYISLHGQEVEEKEARLMEQIDVELSRKSAALDSMDAERLVKLWLQCTKRNGHLVQELCQQLQIVLQPTKMSKYKGDYKSGKRLNMRKLISYIASDYRKDKIWLRRTKPSKRTYNIILAVDNSASMSDNNCRQMTYQSLALLAKSLSLIEAGSLSVVSFGEQVKCIHDFGLPYCDAIGAQFLRDLRFNESKTSYKELLKYSCESFAKQAQASRQNSASNSCSQLLIILSDGRNVTSEEEEVKIYLRQLKSMGILTLFMIIDDLKKNKNNSIVTVQRTLGSGANMTVVNYMELFPFPFYVLVRKLETMPMVLGDALRQWFELVITGY